MRQRDSWRPAKSRSRRLAFQVDEPLGTVNFPAISEDPKALFRDTVAMAGPSHIQVTVGRIVKAERGTYSRSLIDDTRPRIRSREQTYTLHSRVKVVSRAYGLQEDEVSKAIRILSAAPDLARYISSEPEACMVIFQAVEAWRGCFDSPSNAQPEVRFEFERPPALRSLPESFIVRAKRLERVNGIDSALDLIYDSVDGMLRAGDFSELNSLIEHLAVQQFSTDILLGLLTSTLPARSKLPSRLAFGQRVRLLFETRGEDVEALLVGLVN